MIFVFDPIVWGEEHVPFNSALLKTIGLAFPYQTICFAGEDSHIKNLKNCLGEDLSRLIVWKPLAVPPRHAGFFHRLHADFRNVQLLLQNMPNEKKDVFVIMGNPSILWVLKYLMRKGQNNRNIQVIFHGILASLANRRYSLKSRIRYLDPLMRIQNIRTALRLFRDNRIQYIVLEESIRNAVLRELPDLQDNIVVLDHPISSETHVSAATHLCHPVQFGFLGLATKQKGFSQYLKVAAYITKLFPGKAEFHVIGKLSEEYAGSIHSDMTYLSSKPDTEPLDRDEFDQRLGRLHYVCLFYDQHYEFSASGVLMDCISWQKPVIATKLPIFESIENNFGDIGYLCSPDDFVNTCETIIINNDVNRYDNQINNMGQAKRSRSPESLARKYYDFTSRSTH